MMATPAISPSAGLVHVVDDDADLAASVARLLARHGYDARSFDGLAALLAAPRGAPVHCVITDIMMEGDDGFALAERVRQLDPAIAVVFMTAWPTVAGAVDSVRQHGGLDYLEKPIDEARLLAAVAEGVRWSQERRRRDVRIAALTPRERQVFGLLVQGHSNKSIAATLGLSPKTVEDHRAAVLSKTGATSLVQLIALAS